MDDLKQMTGQANFSAPRALVLDELKLVGNSIGKVGGYFKYVGLTEEKDAEEKYPVTLLAKKDGEGNTVGEPVKLVFLIVRRRLVESGKEGPVRWTAEHDRADDVTQLFDENKNKEKGVASALRQKYEKLRTEQVIYCRYMGKVIRLRVKGLALRPTEKKDNYTSFYEYMQSFKGEGFHEYATKMTPVEVQTDTGQNWAINFERGDKPTDDQLEIVAHDIRSTYTHNKEIDAYYNKPVAPVEEETVAVAGEGDFPENFYPTDEDSQEMQAGQSF